MKKILTITSLVVLHTIFSTSVAFVQQDKVNINGEVVQVNGDGSLIVLLKDGSNVIVYPAAGETFDASLIGITVHIRGSYNSDGSIQSEWVKAVGVEDEVDNVSYDKSDLQGKGKGLEKEKIKDKSDDGDGEGNNNNNTYCSGENYSDHPFAASIAETYRISMREVTGYFYHGYWFGQIMLAL